MHDTTAWHWPEVPPSSDLISLSTTADAASTANAPTPTSTITPESAVTPDGRANQQPGDAGALALSGSSGPEPQENGSIPHAGYNKGLLGGVILALLWSLTMV